MKKYFFTGLVILIPIALTLAIVQFLFNFLTAPFLGIVGLFVSHARDSELAELVTKLLILIFVPLLIIAIGVLGRIFIINYFFGIIDSIVRHIPGISGIYKSIQESVRALLKAPESEYSRVALVPFPQSDSYAIAFVTREEAERDQGSSPPQNITVFIPGTPNPTAGFMLLFQRNEVIYLDMKIEDAAKYLLSGGIISKKFIKATKGI